MNHNRRSIRLRGYDYTQPGAYFVTIVTAQRRQLFGEIRDGHMQVNDAAIIVEDTWADISIRFPFAAANAFVVMPNHIHGIIVISRGEASAGVIAALRDIAAEASPLPPRGTTPGSLGAIVQYFKSASTRRINALQRTAGQTIWQRNYYERIIRNERALAAARRYIIDNPARWDLDNENE